MVKYNNLKMNYHIFKISKIIKIFNISNCSQNKIKSIFIKKEFKRIKDNINIIIFNKLLIKKNNLKIIEK